MNFTLAFDVYGTLIDTRRVFHVIQRHLPKDKALSLNELWRTTQLEYSFRRGLMDAYVDFSVCTEEAFLYSCAVLQISLAAEQRAEILGSYAQLPPFSDVVETLQHLSKSGHRLFAFSNGSKKALTTLLGNAQISTYFEDLVSVEDVMVFKPSPKVYAHFNRNTKSSPKNSCLVSGNPFDVIGARSYGMYSVWVQRNSKRVFDPWGIAPSQTIKNLSQLEQALLKIA